MRRKPVPGSKFAAFWRIFVPGSSLPLYEIPARFPPTTFIRVGEAPPHERSARVVRRHTGEELSVTAVSVAD